MRKVFLPALLIVTAITVGCFVDNKLPAEKNAKEYASEMIPDAEHFSCVNLDNDHNGYVSCSVRTKDKKIIPLECAGVQKPWSYPKNTGCKLPQMKQTIQE